MGRIPPAPPLRIERRLTRLTVYTACELRHGGPVHELLLAAARLGVAGGTTFVGFAGFGSQRHLHEPRRWHGPDCLPYALVFVDTAERIAELKAVLARLLPSALAAVDEVETVRYIRSHRHRD